MAAIPPPHSATIAAIYAHHEANRSNWESDGLSVSTLGNECDRALFYAFRWASYPEHIDGRKARLFETGNREEERMIAELCAIGCEVTGEQERISACGGHVRGKIDGRVLGLPDAPKTEHLFETKTHKADSWRAVVKHGVKAKKPAHYAQCQIGMHLTGCSRAFYLAHNKDTDELHAERIEYDSLYCIQLLARAERIVRSDIPPPKISDNPDYFACKFCPARAQCHEAEMPRKHCRTCIFSSPVDNGWHCERFNGGLSRNDQKLGCEKHLFLPGLVPGEQIDCDETAGTVTYRLANGELWVDGVRE